MLLPVCYTQIFLKMTLVLSLIIFAFWYIKLNPEKAFWRQVSRGTSIPHYVFPPRGGKLHLRTLLTLLYSLIHSYPWKQKWFRRKNSQSICDPTLYSSLNLQWPTFRRNKISAHLYTKFARAGPTNVSKRPPVLELSSI